MKAFTKLKTFCLLILGSLLVSCSAMNSLTIPVTEPAPVFLPPSVRAVGILDRSLPGEKTEKMDKIDKILSVEGVNLDKEAAATVTTALLDELTALKRFEQVGMIESPDTKNPGMGVFPAMMSWDQISRLCDANGIDAIIALSFFDTDTNVKYDADAVSVQAPFGVKIPALRTQAVSTTLMKVGWRLYDANSQLVVDEFTMLDEVVVEGSGMNPLNAVKAITVDRKEQILNVSNHIGRSYASRLYPYESIVSRNYFVKGANNFEVAKRRAQTGDWDGAAELWEQELKNRKAKVAGRAYYNMAIINEINGDLEKAIELASQSYSDYNNKEALNYVKILQNRLERIKELEQQNSQ
jgi:tetratricopeptide (TPR) repeat protein